MKYRGKTGGCNIYTHLKYMAYEDLEKKTVCVSYNRIWIPAILENINCFKLLIEYDKKVGDIFDLPKKIITEKFLKNNL